MNRCQISLLSSFLDQTQSVKDAAIVINKYPTMLLHYHIDNQMNIDVLQYLLLQGLLPTESYLYRVCDNENVEVIEMLCEFDVFRRVHGDNIDDISIYVAKRAVANIFLKYGFIGNDMYQSYCGVWTSLDVTM